MAVFSTQIQALVGGITESEIDDWATDAVKEIINILPPKLKMECATITSLTSSTPMDLDATGEIFHVTRENADNGYHIGCREVNPILAGSAGDSTSLHYVTITDPIYWIESDTGGDPKLFVKPDPTANQPARVYHVAFPTVNASDVSAIVNFPDEAEYLVVLYAAVKGLQNKMNELGTNADIDTTAFAAINTELDETQVVCDLINTQVDSAVTAISSASTEIGLANAEVDKMAAETGLDNAELDKATAEIADTVTLVDAGIDTATAAIATASGRINTSVALANGQFDAGVLEAAQAEGEADDAAVATALTAINTNVDSAVAEVVLAKAEAAEIATQTDGSSSDLKTALDAMNTELDKVDEICVEANTEFDKCTALLDLGEADSEGAVNTAAAKIITELDDTRAVCDLIDADLVLAKAEVVLAKAEAAELATQTANSGDIETALDAINTVIDRFRADGGDPALFGDEDTYYTLGGEMTRVKDALDKARNLVDGATMSGDTEPESAQYWLNDEDTEMVQATIQTAQTEIQRAKMHISEWNTTVQALLGEADGFGKEVQARVAFSGAKGQAIKGHISTAQAYVATAQGFGNEVQARISTANGYIAEITIRLQQAQAKRQESQSRVESGNAYLKEAQGRIAQANGYAQEVSARGGFTQAKFQAVQSYINTAGAYIQASQAFANEVQAYANSVGIFKTTSENRINLGNAFLAEANASSQEAQSYVNEVSARVAQVSAQIGVAQGYIANGAGYSRVADGYSKAAQGFLGTATSYIQNAQSYINASQGYATEIQSKINIAQGYAAEANVRMARDTQKYQWLQAQQLKLQQDYDKGIQILVSGGMPQPKQERAK